MSTSWTLGMKRKLGRLFRSSDPVHRHVVLLYHAIGDGQWDVTIRDFEQQMKFLAAEGTCLSMNDLPADKAEGMLVTVTFDDGYASLLDNATPVLVETGLQAAVYLSTACIGHEKRLPSDPAAGHYPNEEFLTWDDARCLMEAGWTIGSHGYHHSDYTTKATDQTLAELQQSRELISDNLGIACDHFAYPYGRYNRSLVDTTARAGFKTAVTGIHASFDGQPLLEIPRINIDGRYTLDDFKAIMHGDWDYLGWYQRGKRLLQ